VRHQDGVHHRYEEPWGGGLRGLNDQGRYPQLGHANLGVVEFVDRSPKEAGPVVAELVGRLATLAEACCPVRRHAALDELFEDHLGRGHATALV
jgi:hypothetical protein